MTPVSTSEPWKELESNTFKDPDERTVALSAILNKAFFDAHFQKGTLIIVEEFDVQDYEKYFSVDSLEKSYLYNYIRLNTAHGDVRRIGFNLSGFSSVDINTVTSHIRTQSANLALFMNSAAGWTLTTIPAGYPYIAVTKEDESLASPYEVSRLRDGRFCSRHATVIDHAGLKYSLILVVDGKRRTMDHYKQLGRQRNSGCGITLSSQRGTFISAHGVKICHYNELFDADALADFDVLEDNTEHHLFFLDGPFELVTNRNAPAPSAHKTLTDPSFLDKIKAFLNDVVRKRSRGEVVKGLVARLGEERTHQREDQYHKMMEQVKSSLPDRTTFIVEDLPVLAERRFFEPALGEENTVGALFTLFSHLVPKDHALIQHWRRPLTFKSFGIDAVACRDESKIIESLEYVEYKHTFATDVEFNHPFSITSMIVCWEFKDCALNTQITDNYDYVGFVKSFIESDGIRLGFTIGDIRLRSGLNEIGNVITVLSLKRLLAKTFKVKERAPPPKPAKAKAAK
ncbi:hypothetical protein [Anatilimnocola floriformis]|uniref:hypothetical protein n=1 Tax=Anatilimnocola floriformis TaxID=2948575 RepID=UPI0020C21FC7|nr:hypothetical protein [Anatilimnocola floriformis]